MAYSTFTLERLKSRLGVTVRRDRDLFGAIPAAPASPFLNQILERNVAVALAVSSEKARSELIIARS